MSRSSPPASPTAASAPKGIERPAPVRRKRLGLRVASSVRWLHTYLSMFSMAALLFFGVTGITLNHPDWFSSASPQAIDHKGHLNPDWVRSIDGEDSSEGVAKLEIVEQLRQEHGIGGALDSFTSDEYECVVSFKGPAYSADIFIDRETGDYELTEVRQGLIALINDLHKGRDTGASWSWVIDVSAAFLTIVSLTGLLLLFYIKRRRALGLATALLGTLVVVLVFVLGVP